MSHPLASFIADMSLPGMFKKMLAPVSQEVILQNGGMFGMLRDCIILFL